MEKLDLWKTKVEERRNRAGKRAQGHPEEMGNYSYWFGGQKGSASSGNCEQS